MLNRIALIASFGVLVGAAAPARARRTRSRSARSTATPRMPAFIEPYRKGWELAVEEVNAAGGVLGRKLEVISRDDAGKPGDAVRIAEELVSREGVALMAGTFLSNVGLAVADFAKQKQGVLPRGRAADRRARLGERQPLHLPPAPQHLHAGGDAGAGGGQAADEALGHRRAQLRVRPVGGGAFKAVLKQAPARRRVRRRAVAGARQDRRRRRVQALADAKPEAIFNVTFGADLPIRARGQHARAVRGRAGGQPADRRARVPRPAARTRRRRAGSSPAIRGTRSRRPSTRSSSSTPTHASATTTRGWARWSATRRSGRSPKASRRPESTDTEKLIAAFNGLKVDTPFGPIKFRALDHQSTMGAFVGQHRARRRQGRDGRLRYATAPSTCRRDDVVRKLRPQTERRVRRAWRCSLPSSCSS